MTGIETPRLILRLVPLEGLEATAHKDTEAARRIIGNVPDCWFDEAWVSEMRFNQWHADPAYGPWSIRAITLKATGEIVGNMNCHAKPMLFEYHGERGQAVEMGYTVFEPWRRQGIAFEAVKAIMDWAAFQGVRWVILSISPENAASLALARKLGAQQIGSQIDEHDGPEDIYLTAIGRGNVCASADQPALENRRAL